MIKKRKNQLSFAQLQVNKYLDKTNWLQNVNKVLDWEPIRQKLANLHPSNTGRPAYDPVFMFKILLMQQWFNLSDPQAEAQINDRISFKIFLGMDITDTGLDETTICNFRNYIGSIGLADDLFEEINKQFGILHLPVYTFFEKACIIELSADVETGNSKLEIR